MLIPFVPSSEDGVRNGLNQMCGAVQLKGMLRAKGLKVSGVKGELISRLLAAGWENIAGELASVRFYIYSDAGRELAARFDERKQQAYLEAVSAISNHQAQKAIRAYQLLEDELGFPRWAFALPPSPELIELIMELKPAILEACTETVLSRLRMAAAISAIAGRNAPKNLLDGVVTGIRLDPDTAARMFYFAARHAEDMQKWRQIRIREVKLLATVDSCPVCSRLHGRQWRLEDAPELPRKDCGHVYGCRCLYQPVLAGHD